MNAYTQLEIQRLSYLRTSVYRLMSRIEDAHGGIKTWAMFHEIYPELQNEWETIDPKCEVKVIENYYRKLCRLVDSLEMD